MGLDRWTKNGSKKADVRALEIADKKLEAYTMPEMDPQVLAELDEFVAMRKSQLDIY